MLIMGAGFYHNSVYFFSSSELETSKLEYLLFESTIRGGVVHCWRWTWLTLWLAVVWERPFNLPFDKTTDRDRQRTDNQRGVALNMHMVKGGIWNASTTTTTTTADGRGLAVLELGMKFTWTTDSFSARVAQLDDGSASRGLDGDWLNYQVESIWILLLEGFKSRIWARLHRSDKDLVL